jgi:hypothetical protein
MPDSFRTAYWAASMAADCIAELRVAAAAGRPGAFHRERAVDLLRQTLAALGQPAPAPAVLRVPLIAPPEPRPPGPPAPARVVGRAQPEAA